MSALRGPLLDLNPPPDDAHATCTRDRNCGAMACPAVQATARRAAARAGSWSPLAWDGAGWSLGGRPLPSGATVELQEVSGHYDAFGSYHRALQAGIPVQFFTPDECPDRPLLRRLVGGHKFAACFEPWMRFRWEGGR